MAKLLVFAIIIVGPVILLLLHGRSLLRRGRGGKLSQRGRVEIITGIALLAFLLPPFFVGLSNELRSLYQLNTTLFLGVAFPATIFVIFYILQKAKIFSVNLYIREFLNKFNGKSKQPKYSNNKIPSKLSKRSDDSLVLEIHKILDQLFNDEELRTLCVYLNVDYDNLHGQNKSGKARELILHLKRRNRIHKLIKTGMEIRPDINWRNALMQEHK